jgi:hypothetical protein
MNKKLIALLLIFPLLSVSLFIGKVNAEAPVIKVQEIQVKENYTREEVYQIALLTADKYNINRHNFLVTIDQESNFEQYAKGDNGSSLGACQIHSSNNIPSNKRYDPIFCLDWTAKQFISGKSRLWTGYRLCVLNETIIHNGKRLACNATGTM